MKVNLILLCNFVALILTAGCERWDQVESRYEDFHAAKYAISSGWVPEYLPRSATDILEVHNVDTNEVQLRASIDLKSISSFTRICKSVDANGIVHPRKRFRIWWPSELLNNSLSQYQPELSKFSFYKCGESEFIAIDTRESIFYFWISSE